MRGGSGKEASRRRTGLRDRASLALGFFLFWTGAQGAWMRAAWRLMEQRADPLAGTELTITLSASKTSHSAKAAPVPFSYRIRTSLLISSVPVFFNRAMRTLSGTCCLWFRKPCASAFWSLNCTTVPTRSVRAEGPTNEDPRRTLKLHRITRPSSFAVGQMRSTASQLGSMSMVRALQEQLR